MVIQMFDVRMLLVVMGVILVLTAFRFVFPDLKEVFGIEFMVYFVSLLGMMVLMHYLGFIEGKETGFKKGIIENEQAFFFLPHTGAE